MRRASANDQDQRTSAPSAQDKARKGQGLVRRPEGAQGGRVGERVRFGSLVSGSAERFGGPVEAAWTRGVR